MANLIPTSQFALTSGTLDQVRRFARIGNPVCAAPIYNLTSNGVRIDVRNYIPAGRQGRQSGWYSVVRVINTDEQQTVSPVIQALLASGVLGASTSLDPVVSTNGTSGPFAPREVRYYTTTALDAALNAAATPPTRASVRMTWAAMPACASRRRVRRSAFRTISTTRTTATSSSPPPRRATKVRKPGSRTARTTADPLKRVRLNKAGASAPAFFCAPTSCARNWPPRTLDDDLLHIRDRDLGLAQSLEQAVARSGERWFHAVGSRPRACTPPAPCRPSVWVRSSHGHQRRARHGLEALHHRRPGNPAQGSVLSRHANTGIGRAGQPGRRRDGTEHPCRIPHSQA